MLKVGGEVDAFCTKCKMVLAHTVLAIWAGDIKRVRCNTCMGEHAFRKSEPGSSSTSSTPRATKPRAKAADKPKAAEVAAAAGYDNLIAGKDRSTARRYDLKQKFAVGELVQHPSFGLGVVAAVRGLDKIDVAFPSTVKTLMHNKGAAPTSFARPAAPKRPDVEEPVEATPESPADEADAAAESE